MLENDVLSRQIQRIFKKSFIKIKYIQVIFQTSNLGQVESLGEEM